MIKITYLDHSGFVVTLAKAILVFDYFRDPSHSLNKILGDYPGLPVVFFASHRHPDHYNQSIYATAQNRRRVYVLSNDIDAKKIPTTLEVEGMSPGDYKEGLPGEISVKAYPSTDEGVSFLVTLADGKKIFHAGDLNDWHWQDESTFREVESASLLYRNILKRRADAPPRL
ncbi:MAG: MBL fold metallo-hydrolase, partial [Muribaculaceae bacterium]|nr:MBL fold metallo-hydrolase [Muribaculaceae bacterium]